MVQDMDTGHKTMNEAQLYDIHTVFRHCTIDVGAS